MLPPTLTSRSVAAPGPETARYGGNTSTVEVRADDGTLLVLDAGTGLRRLGAQIAPDTRRVDILLTHLHMDHIQGLGFFAPLYNPDMEVHIWGPGTAVMRLKARLMKSFSSSMRPSDRTDWCRRVSSWRRAAPSTGC